MCGFVYQNIVDAPSEIDLELLQRGPDGIETLNSPLGYFLHARLDTKPHSIRQPAQNLHGVLLYNGTEYALLENDTGHILDHLTNDTISNLELLKELTGDFSICFVTDQHVFLARDCFGTKPLFYGQQDNKFIVASSKKAILLAGLTPRTVDINTLIVFARESGNILNKYPIIEWNYSQGKTTLEDVWQQLEISVLTRFDKNTVLTLSSGYDSGIIAACLNKYNKKYSIMVRPDLENKQVLDDRIKLHNGDVEIVTTGNSIINLPSYPNQNIIDLMCNVGNFGINNNIKVVLTGLGGDELYSDYGFSNKKFFSCSKFGGAFPDDLGSVFPWHLHGYPLTVDLPAVEYIGGFFGLDSRHPLLDQKLFQTWLNTSTTIKNKSYKYFMKEYFNKENYPYAMEKIGSGTPVTSYFFT